MNKDYSSIINLPHYVSKNRKQMSLNDRAAQFSPFAALTGYDQKINDTSIIYEEKIILSDDSKFELNEKLLYLLSNLGIEATFVYFDNFISEKKGNYLSKTSKIKKYDEINNSIILIDKSIIKIDDIIDIKINNK